MLAAESVETLPTATKLQVQKLKTSRDGQVVFLRFTGVLDEDFHGQRLSSSISCRLLVVDLAGVRRISSYGIAEWSEFIRRVARRADEIVLVACSPKVVDQLNLVSDFAGRARLHSLLAPYRCDRCGLDEMRLLQLDKDREIVETRQPPDHPCQCGGTCVFDDDPGVYLSYASRQEPVTLPPEVQAHVATELSSRIEGTADLPGLEFRAEKFVQGRCSLLRLAGYLDGTFPDEKLADGIEGTIVLDVAGVARVSSAGGALWRNFLSVIGSTADRVHLVGVPAVVFEPFLGPQDIGPRGQVVSIVLPFSCTGCGTVTETVTDFAENHDLFRMATPPEHSCPDCGAETRCSAPESVLVRLARLPEPEMSPSLLKFIREATRKLNREPRPTTVKETDPARRVYPAFAAVVGAAAVAVVASAAAVIVFLLMNRRQEVPILESEASVHLVSRSAPERPAWVASDLPLHGDCQVMGDRLRCQGVSSHVATVDEGSAEAAVSALDGFVQFTALQVSDPDWQRTLNEIYGAARLAKLDELQQARRETDHDRHQNAIKEVVDSRVSVVKALRRTAGSLAPAQMMGEYWEEYENVARTRRTYLVFAALEVSLARSRMLAESYSRPVLVRGARAITMFPGVAWRYSDLSGGAIMLELGHGTLRGIGLADRYIVLSVQGRPVETADDLAAVLAEEIERLKGGGSIKLLVKTGDGQPVEFSHPVQALVRGQGEGEGRGRRSSRDDDVWATPLTTWDRVGGKRSFRDDPSQ